MEVRRVRPQLHSRERRLCSGSRVCEASWPQAAGHGVQQQQRCLSMVPQEVSSQIFNGIFSAVIRRGVQAAGRTTIAENYSKSLVSMSKWNHRNYIISPIWVI